jgi:hypothetical protein
MMSMVLRAGKFLVLVFCMVQISSCTSPPQYLIIRNLSSQSLTITYLSGDFGDFTALSQPLFYHGTRYKKLRNYVPAEEGMFEVNEEGHVKVTIPQSTALWIGDSWHDGEQPQTLGAAYISLKYLSGEREFRGGDIFRVAERKTISISTITFE